MIVIVVQPYKDTKKYALIVKILQLQMNFTNTGWSSRHFIVENSQENATNGFATR
jgi:hypothetical protein